MLARNESSEGLLLSFRNKRDGVRLKRDFVVIGRFLKGDQLFKTNSLFFYSLRDGKSVDQSKPIKMETFN